MALTCSLSFTGMRLLPVMGEIMNHSVFCTPRPLALRCSQIVKRCLSSSRLLSHNISLPEGHTLLLQGQQRMDQFGCVQVHGSSCIEITPNLDPKDYSDGQAVVHYCLYTTDVQPKRVISHPKYDAEKKSLQFDCSCDSDELAYRCILKLPIKADVDLQLYGENEVWIANMESEVLSIQNAAGLCHLKDNKCTKVNIDNGRGNIRCEGVLQGQLNLTTTHTGNIVTDRLQGSVISLYTEAGDVDIKSVYAEKTDITTQRGNIHVKNCHHRMKVDINEEGNLKIDSLDGNLLAFIVKGNTDVFISRQERVLIRTKEGNIDLRVPEDLVASLDLHGDQVKVHDDIHLSESEEVLEEGKVKVIGEMNGNDDEIPSSINHKGNYHVLHAETTKGSITLRCQDWFSSLNLTSSMKD